RRSADEEDMRTKALALPVVAAAVSAIAAGCALISRDPDALKAAARRELDQGRPVEALQSPRDAVEVAPRGAEAQYLLGIVALRSERQNEAEAALARAVELSPNDPRALSAHGLALRAQGRYTEAESALLRSLVMRPGDGSTIAALGEVYRLWD